MKRLLNTAVLVFFLCLIAPVVSFASHIVGGELTYRYLGANNYQIRLVVFRDCGPNSMAPYDDPATLGIFDVFNNLLDTKAMPFLGSTQIPNILNSPCQTPPSNICYEVTTYIDTLNLPPLAGGYQLAYQRCCRNISINNIVAPNNAGATYYCKIPGPAITSNNSSPFFINLPPTYLCVGFPFSFNHAAFDYNGDSLVYSLFTPLDGQTVNPPGPGAPTDPPYSPVTFASPYSLTNMFGGANPLTIDLHTGMLTATPTTIGQFVYGVRVSEYRKGKYLGETNREFQANVINCTGVVLSAIQSPVILCGSFDAHFVNGSIGAAGYHWDFGVSSLTNDTSNLFNPTYTYPDTGTYTAKLIAKSSTNPLCNDTSLAIVHVYPQLIADPGKLTDPCVNTAFFFDSTISHSGVPNQWNWDFGDGTTHGTQKNEIHTYNAVGNFLITLTVTTVAGCTSTITDTIKIFPLLTGVISQIKPAICEIACTGSATAFPHGGVPPYNYSWSDGQSTSEADTLCPGHYTILVTDSNGCIFSNSVIIYQTFNTLINNIQFAACDSFCNGTATVQINGGTLPYSYLWNTGDTLSTIDSLCAGVYFVTAIDSNGCSLTDTIQIKNSFFAALLDSNNVRCFGECNGGATAFAGGGTPPYQYAWNDGQSGSTASGWCPGTYVVTTLDQNGCRELDTINITQPTLLKDTLSKDDGRCPLECNGTASINTSGGTAPYVYSWNSQSAISQPSISNICPGWNSVLTTDSHGCTYLDSIQVFTLFTSPEIHTSIEKDSVFQGESTQLFSDPGSGYLYLWASAASLNDPTYANPIATPPASTQYLLRVTDANGCTNFDSVSVYVITDYCKDGVVFVPNAFTPDGDGHNDKFRVRAKGVKEIELSVYNRWGEKVFETKDMNDGWDGTYKGINSPTEVYMFYLTTTCFDNNKVFRKGNVTLIR